MQVEKEFLLHLHTGRSLTESAIQDARTTVAQWLRCCATNRKVAGSIPAGVSGFFIDIKSFRWPWHTGRSLTESTVPDAGTAVAQLLRCCATNRKVAGSIPAGVSGFFIDIPIALWSWVRLSL